MNKPTPQEIPESKCVSYGSGLTEAEEATIAAIITRIIDAGGYAIFHGRAPKPSTIKASTAAKRAARRVFRRMVSQGIIPAPKPKQHPLRPTFGVAPDAPSSPFMAEFVQTYVADIAKRVGFDHMIVGIDGWLRSLDLYDGSVGSRMADAMQRVVDSADHDWRQWVDYHYGPQRCLSERQKDAYGFFLASEANSKKGFDPEDPEADEPGEGIDPPDDANGNP